jgi:hypothetical protein
MKRSSSLRLLCCIAMATVLFFQGSTWALSAAQKSVFNLGINYFDVNDRLASCAVAVDVSLSGNSNAEKAFGFFVSQGLTPAQAAGVTGNLMWESGLDPENIQNPAGRSRNPADAGQAGWGIAQWTPGQKITNIAKAAGVTDPIYELSAQLEVLWAELSNGAGGTTLEKKAGDDIKATTTIDEATRAFQGDQNSGGKYVGFERPGDESATISKRIVLAKQIFNKYGSSPGTAQVATSNNSCSSTSPGQNTRYVDGFTIYSQYDPAWAGKPYGSTTIADAGCGPSAMAMIITALTGRSVTPDQTAAYASQQNLYIPGAGSSWDIARVLAAHWDLSPKPIGKDATTITATLQAGGLVIASGQGPLPFTSGGHYIVIRAATTDGKWKVGDSGHDETNSKTWSPQELLAYMNDGSVYAITK